MKSLSISCCPADKHGTHSKSPFRPKAAGRRVVFFEKSVLPATATTFFLSIVYGGITTFAPHFAESIQVNPGTFFLVYAVTLTAMRPVAGKLSDRYGAVSVIVPTLVVTTFALLMLSISDGLIGVIVSAVLYGIGFGSAQPALQATTLRLAYPDRRGGATASFMTAFDLGIGLGAIMLGWVSQYTGYQVLFTVCAVSAVVSQLIFIGFVKRLSSAAERTEQNIAQ